MNHNLQENHQSGEGWNSLGPDWSRRSTSVGYEAVYFPSHPSSWSTGYIHSHRVIAEQKLGRLLRSDEIVHHVDGNRLNNHPDNLEVTDRSAHARHHGLLQGKTFIELTCTGCGVEFQRRKGNEPAIKRCKEAFCSRQCYWTSLKGPRQ